MEDDSNCVLQAFYEGYLENGGVLFVPAEDDNGKHQFHDCFDFVKEMLGIIIVKILILKFLLEMFKEFFKTTITKL